MSEYHYPSTCHPLPYVHPGAYPRPGAGSGHLEMGRLGFTVGVCGAGAANLRRLRHDEIQRTDAVVDTLRTGVASGLATAAASLVAGQFRSPTLALVASLAAGTAVMYALSAEKPSGESNER